MDVDEIEELVEHLVDAFLALRHVLVDEVGEFFASFVDAVARGPDGEGEGDQLTGELEVAVPVEPLIEAATILGGIEYGS